MKFAVKLASSQPDKWLSWLVAASLMFPLIFFGLVAHQSRVATIAANDQQMVGTVTLLREHAKKVLDTDELVIQQVDRLIAGLSWEAIARSESLHQQLNQLNRQLPQVGGIVVVAPDGTIANSSGPMPAEAINVSNSDYFAALRDGYQGAYISNVHRGRSAGAEWFDFARRRSSPDGHFDGVIHISDRPTYFADTYRILRTAHP